MAVFKYSRILSLNHYKFIVNFCGEQRDAKAEKLPFGTDHDYCYINQQRQSEI